MSQTNRAASQGKVAKREFNSGSRSGYVVVVVMPHEYGEFAPVETRERGNVRPCAHTIFQRQVKRYGAIALDSDTLSAHLAEHAKDIEHRLVHAVRCQHAETGKVWLPFKLEGPGQRALKVHAMPVREFVFTRKAIPTQAVFEKVAHELPATAGSVRATNFGSRQGAAHGGNCVVVKLAKFFRRAAPVTDVRFVPNFPVPVLDFRAAIPFEAVLR